MKRNPLVTLAALLFPLAAAAAQTPDQVPDRCDTALLTKISALPDGTPLMAEKSGKIMHDDNDPDLTHGRIDVEQVCDGAVFEFLKGSKLQNVWNDPRTHKASDLKIQARLLLYVNAVFKESDVQAIPVFRLATAILEKTDKAGVLWLSKNKRTLTQAYGGPGADRDVNDVIDATDIVDVGTPLSADVAAISKELVDEQSGRGGVGLVPGPLVVQFNQAIVDWIDKLALMSATKPDFHFDDREGDQKGKLVIRDLGLPIPTPVHTVSDKNAVRKLPAMEALVKEFTGIDAGVVNWGDDSSNGSPLDMIDRAQRNALAIRFAQVERAMNAVAYESQRRRILAVRVPQPTLPSPSTLVGPDGF